MSFSKRAIATSTRHTYDSALAKYRAFCASMHPGQPPESTSRAAAMTVTQVANFLSEMARNGERKHSTLATYRSALSTFWEEAGLLGDTNPTAAPIITRIIDGVRRVQGEADIARRKAGEPPKVPIVDLTPSMLEEMAHALGAGSPDAEAQMHWAATCCFVHGMFRPSELLGSQHRQALLFSQITFFRRGARAAADQAVSLMPSGVRPDADGWMPDYFSVTLFEQKTVQAGAAMASQPAAHPIGDRRAVWAMWQWMHTRRDAGPIQDALFQLPGKRPLSTRRLLEVLEVAALGAFAQRMRFTGKSFRRGGASALMAAGASVPTMQEAGRWRSHAMPDRYANTQAKRERMLEAGKLMRATPYAGLESVVRQ